MRYSTISQIGTFTALGPGAATDYLRLDPSKCDGGDDAPLRVTEEQIPGGDGVYILPPVDDAQILTLVGDLVIRSDGTDPGYYTAQDALLAALKSALNALKAAPGDLVSNDGTISVWKHDRLDPTTDGILKSVTFSLVVDVTA